MSYKKDFQIINSYLQKTTRYPTWRFILELTALTFAIKFMIIIGLLCFQLITHLTLPNSDISFEKDYLGMNIFLVIIFITLFAAFETITSQWFILWLTSKFTKKDWLRILISATVFALLHVEPILIVWVFPVGLILAWVFITKRKISKWQAIWITTAIHSLHNLLALGLLYITDLYLK